MSNITAFPKAPTNIFERFEYIRDFPAMDLIKRLCDVDQVEDVVQEIGLRRDELRRIVKRSPVPLPTSLSDFKWFKQVIFENIQRYDAFLDQTSDLRASLKLVENELIASYATPWRKTK
jgi:hypothetical protein